MLSGGRSNRLLKHDSVSLRVFRSSTSSKELGMFKYEEINMNFEVTLYCAE